MSAFPCIARVIALCGFIAGCSARAADNFDWPQWRGPNRDGVSAETNLNFTWPREGPRRAWVAKVGLGWSGMSVVGNRLYTMGNAADLDAVLCLDANTGRQLWEFNYICATADPNGYHGPRCTPTVDGRLVYTVSRNGDLACVNAETGALVWSHQLVNEFGARIPKWGFAGSPLVEGGLLLVETGARGRSMMAFDKLTGRPVWANGVDTAAYSSPVGFGSESNRFVALFSASGLTVRAARDGRIAGTFPWRTTFDVNAATPVVVGDKLFLSSGYGTGCAMVQVSTNGALKPLWTGKQMRNHVNSCVVFNDHLYGFDDNQNAQFRCISTVNGNIRWTTPALGKGSIILAGDKMILYTERGRLVVVEAAPDTYREIASAQLVGGRDTWVPPALSHGRLYVRSAENLLCFDLSTREPTPAKKGK